MRVYLANNGDYPVYFVKAEARTDALADKLFTIYDVYESYIDISTGLPIKSIRDIAENNYRYYNEVVFMRSTKQVFSSRSGVHASKEHSKIFFCCSNGLSPICKRIFFNPFTLNFFPSGPPN